MEDDPFVPGSEEDSVAGGEALPRFADAELENPRVIPRPRGHVRRQRLELRPPLRSVGVVRVGAQNQEVDIAPRVHLPPGRRTEKRGEFRRHSPPFDLAGQAAEKLLAQLGERLDVGAARWARFKRY